MNDSPGVSRSQRFGNLGSYVKQIPQRQRTRLDQRAKRPSTHVFAGYIEPPIKFLQGVDGGNTGMR